MKKPQKHIAFAVFMRKFINKRLKNKPYVVKCRFLFLKFYKSESVCAEGESGNISFDLVKIMLLVGNGDGCAIFCSDRADVNGNLFIFVIYDNESLLFAVGCRQGVKIATVDRAFNGITESVELTEIVECVICLEGL